MFDPVAIFVNDKDLWLDRPEASVLDHTNPGYLQLRLIMLLEIGIVLGTYISLRTMDRQKINNHVQEESLSAHPVKELTTSSDKKELMISFFGLGVSILQPILLPKFTLINAVLLSYSNYPCLRGAEEGLRKRKINNDVLGSGWTVFAIASKQYFAGALGIVVYHLSANLIEKTRSQSKDALVHIFDARDRSVLRLQNGIELTVPLEQVELGDLIVVHSSEMIPVDGEIISGYARIDEHILTGESRIIEKIPGDVVFASTLLVSGEIHIQVKKAGDDTVVAKIEGILNQTTNFRSDLQLKGEELADESAPYVLSAALLTALTTGPTSAAAVLSAQFGYQIRMAAPLNTLRHLSRATASGILVKDGRSLERLNEIDTVLFDKTGTLTEEQPEVGRVIRWSKYTSEDILRFSATAEVKLKHPIARAILHAYAAYNKPLQDVDDAHYEMGFGTKVYLEEKVIRVGSLRFMENEGLVWDEDKQTSIGEIYQQGHSVVIVGVDYEIVGAIEIRPRVRPEISALIGNLKRRNIKNLIIVSGDHEELTKKLAENLGMTTFFAEVLPDEKSNIVNSLQERGHKVCFVGDGINDTIAMKKSDVSVSLHGASTIATDTADIILLNDNLGELSKIFDIAQDLNNIMKHSIAMVLTPAVIILTGGVFLHISLLAAVLIKQGFLGVNILYILRNTKLENNRSIY